MDKIKVTHELLALFLDGKTTPAETYAILKAAREDWKTQFILHMALRNGVISVAPEQNKSALPVCKLFAIRLRHLPVRRLAASSEVNDCVVKCEQHVLNDRGLQARYNKLYKEAVRRNWLQSEGTPLYHIGRLLELSTLSVSRQFGGTIDGLLKEINGNCSVIVALNAERLTHPKARTAAICNHAVVVIDINVEDGYIELYDPQSANPSDRYPIDDFLRAWKSAKNFFVSIVERGVRPYTPHPEYVAHIKLPEEIVPIADMLAENAHEIWAKDRLAEAEKKREKGEVVNPYDDPFMKPFSELSKLDRRTDYLSALNTIKLLYKLGFEITTDQKALVDYRPNVRTADGQYIPHPINVDDVVLPREIADLTEYIAENAHEEWAKQRLKEGWTFAPKTNKKLKQSFDLVPYCELLDSEKEYDRKMAMNTLKVLYQLGYKIEKRDE